MAYPFQTILSLLTFAEVGELEKFVGENGELKYQDIKDVIGEKYMIEFDQEKGEEVIVTIKDGIVSDLCPHQSWDGIMFILPHVHTQIHHYEKHCTTHNHRMSYVRVHELILRAEESIIDHYTLSYTWQLLQNLSLVLDSIKKYLPNIPS